MLATCPYPEPCFSNKRNNHYTKIQDGPNVGIQYTIYCIPIFGPPCIFLNSRYFVALMEGNANLRILFCVSQICVRYLTIQFLGCDAVCIGSCQGYCGVWGAQAWANWALNVNPASFCKRWWLFTNWHGVVCRNTVIPRLTKIIRSGITFVSRNLR